MLIIDGSLLIFYSKLISGFINLSIFIILNRKLLLEIRNHLIIIVLLIL